MSAQLSALLIITDLAGQALESAVNFILLFPRFVSCCCCKVPPTKAAYRRKGLLIQSSRLQSPNLGSVDSKDLKQLNTCESELREKTCAYAFATLA